MFTTSMFIIIIIITCVSRVTEEAGLTEQSITISGVGLAVESHGEEGRSAGFFFNAWEWFRPDGKNR